MLYIKQALRQAQLELDAMKEQCRALQEQVRIAEANKSRKSSKASAPEALNTFDTEIQTLTKKFGVLAEMFPPSKDVLSRPLTLLRLTRVEANVDSKTSKGQGSLKGFFKGRGLGASAASLSNSRLRKTFQGDGGWGLPQQVFSNDRLRKTVPRVIQGSIHSRVV